MLYLWKKNLRFSNDKNYWKVRDYCHFTGKHRDAAHTICNFKFNAPNETPVVFHNGPSYDYHFIIIELANEFERQLECLWENIEKYKSFLIPIEKEVKVLIKMVMKELQLYLTKKNLLIAQDLYQVHYQMLFIISQKEFEFIKLSVKIVIVFLNIEVSRTI